MPKNAADIVEELLSDDPKKWGKLSSDITYRRLELLLLRDILVELKKLNKSAI
jgi:hypothetical protein